jgi:hypothetical protein
VCVCVLTPRSRSLSHEIREFASSILVQKEAQKERKSDDQRQNPGQISLELRGASLCDAATCWSMADVDAHGSKLSFVESVGGRVSEMSATRQVSNEVEAIGTDDLIVSWRELAEWEIISAWEFAVCGRGKQEWLGGGSSRTFGCAGSWS